MARIKAGGFDAALGLAVREGRARRRIPMTALAARLGVTHQQIQKYENGRNRLTAYTLVQIGEVLGVSPGALITRALMLQRVGGDGRAHRGGGSG